MDDNLVGRRFKELISKSGKSQKEMAELLSTSTVFISNIVSGKRGIGHDMQRRLRDMGFDVDWVLTGRRDINDGGSGAPKSKITALLLCLFLGFLGIHRFYLGHTMPGVIQLFTGGGCVVWALIDLVQIITGNMKDSQGNALT